MMGLVALCVFFLISSFEIHLIGANRQDNVTINAVPRQLTEFKLKHPKPIGVLTTSAGAPVDLRDTVTFNSDIANSEYLLDSLLQFDARVIPERTVHAKGKGAFGYFVVTHDVSKYTTAEVFNGIGKKTKVFVRFSTSSQNSGGTELAREHRGMAVKMYTEEGNLDLLCLHIPVYDYRDPVHFTSFTRSTRRNPKTNIFDPNKIWDFATLTPDRLHALLWRQSDFGIPYGYRRMDAFPIHAYVVNNEQGDRYIVKFSFRTELGFANLTTAEARAIASQDPDFFTRDLYNAIANKNYPSWRLEMDVMTTDDVKSLDYNPFDVTRLWKIGNYKTVTIGRLVLDENTDNDFRDSEQSAFNPANLVPGIPGPTDLVFKGRRISYRDTQNYRLGANHNNIEVNKPKHAKTYRRDGVPPIKDNMGDAPDYFANSFNGPVAYIDQSRPSEKLLIFDKTSVDLEPVAYFYNEIVKTDGGKQRLANNVAANLVEVNEEIVKRGLKMLSWIDPDLGSRVARAYIKARKRAERAAKMEPRERYQPLAQCMDLFQRDRLKRYFEMHPPEL